MVAAAGSHRRREDILPQVGFKAVHTDKLLPVAHVQNEVFGETGDDCIGLAVGGRQRRLSAAARRDECRQMMN